MGTKKSTVKCGFLAFVLTLILFPGALVASGSAVPNAGERIFSLAGHNVTDTILTGWIVSGIIILLVRCLLRGGVHTIPTHGQAVIEYLINGLQSLFKPIVGEKMFHHIFPLLIGYFVFILVHNWSGLLPGVGSIAVITDGAPRFLLRPTNSDLNTTLALALFSVFAWAYYTIRYSGPRAFYHEIFGNKANKSDMGSVMYSFLFFIFLAVGLIECLSVLFRVVSLSFRLYGNVFGGENLLHYMTGFSEVLQKYSIVRYLAYLLPLPFYLLEFLVGLIQASVFTLLVSVYVGLISNQEEESSVENI